MMTAQPGYSSNPSSSARKVSTSRSLVGSSSSLALRLAGARALPDPFELALEGAPARRLLPPLLFEALLLLLEPTREIALVWDAAAAVENPAGHLVEKWSS